MSIARFFSAELKGQVIEMSGAEAHHLLNVRRVRAAKKWNCSTARDRWYGGD